QQADRRRPRHPRADGQGAPQVDHDQARRPLGRRAHPAGPGSRRPRSTGVDLHLGAIDAGSAVAESAPTAAAMSTTPTIYVAVVDDDQSVCRSFARLLRSAGIQPITYFSAEAFLADSKRPQFDCRVFDVQLGGMSGIELA